MLFSPVGLLMTLVSWEGKGGRGGRGKFDRERMVKGKILQISK